MDPLSGQRPRSGRLRRDVHRRASVRARGAARPFIMELHRTCQSGLPCRKSSARRAAPSLTPNGCSSSRRSIASPTEPKEQREIGPGRDVIRTRSANEGGPIGRRSPLTRCGPVSRPGRIRPFRRRAGFGTSGGRGERPGRRPGASGAFPGRWRGAFGDLRGRRSGGFRELFGAVSAWRPDAHD